MTTVNEAARAKRLTGDKILSKASTKHATEALQKYIDQFTNVVQTNSKRTPKSGCYASSNVSPLLSTEPESISSQRKATISGKMAEDLVQWVNDSYSRDLQRKIVPFGQRSNSSADTNDLTDAEEGSSDSENEVISTISDGVVQLSTLPSPGSSVVSDIDMGSVNTDVLVKTFHDNNSQQSEGKGLNHPSWVEELVTPKHYPSWVDEIDQSRLTHQETFNVKNTQRNRLSRSLSPSFFQQHLLPSPPSAISTSLQKRPTEISDKPKTRGIAWDLESTDTEVLISESIYGRQPVNMGGDLHSLLYRDKKIQQLHEHSVRKFAKESERSFMKEMSFAQSHVEERKIKENISSTMSQRLKKARNTPSSKTPIAKHSRKKKSSDSEDQDIIENRLLLQPNRFGKEDFTSSNKPSSLKLPKRDGVHSNSDVRKNSTGSSNTDRLMRQSPTGIEMSKQNSGAKPKYKENSRRKDVSHLTTKFRTPTQATVVRTPDVLYSTKVVRASNSEVTPRRNASQELQRIIDLAEVKSSEDPRQRNDHYLNGRVSKESLTMQDVRNRDLTMNQDVRNRHLTMNNDRRNTFNGSRPIKHIYSSHPPRIDTRNLSPRGVERIPPRNKNLTKNHERNLYVTSTPGTQTSRNSAPSKFIPDTKTRDRVFSSRSRTKSAPNIEGSRMRKSLPYKRGYRVDMRSQNRAPRRGAHYVNERIISDANYANESIISDGNYANESIISDGNYVNDRIISDADYANERIISDGNYANDRIISDGNYVKERISSERQDEETESVDTEALVIKPPMPVFNGSPSLTTESAESTLGSEESDDTLIENLALRTSFLATDPELHSSSETSYLELSRSYQQGGIAERSQDWNGERPFNTRLNFNSKPGIITSFLEDCMRSSQESRRSNMKLRDEEFHANSVSEEEHSIISDVSSERPVETLKKMLFTVQRLAHSSEETSDRDVNNEDFETQSESLTEEILSEILSTASRNEGQDSLSRAYYHLARLKRLVSASKEVAAWK